ncbi:MAG: hypothetical protein MUE73_19615, partial [Planctomycetes bacterium]|nr:hypothetical protein [Planctomycetota bacterium]
MKDGKEEEAPERWWRFLAWLRRAFKPPRLHWLVFAIIVFLLSILAPKMGIAAALQFILIGLGLGALLTWAVSSWPPGSGVPPLRRIRFFNQSDRDAAGITFRKNPPPGLTIIPPPSGVNLIPPPPPNG